MMGTVTLILGLTALIAAIVLTAVPRFSAAVPAFVGLLVLHLGYHIYIPTQYLWFWGIAALIAAGIKWLAPSGEPDGQRVSNLYIALGAIAGTLIGIISAPRVMVLGTIIGAALGVMAYSGTPAGRWLRSSWQTLTRYFATKGLPAIVAVAIVGIAVMGFIS